MSINADVHKLEPGALIDLYVLNLNPIGVPEVHYFYPGVGDSNQQVKFQGQLYTPWPVKIEGLEKRGTGSEKRPKLTISNYMAVFTAYIELNNDLVGAAFERRRTLAKYLDTEVADITTYSKELFFVEQKTFEDPMYMEFELASAMDFVSKRLPSRIAISNSCPWQYSSTDNGSGCGWPATDNSRWFDKAGAQVFTAQEDTCGKRLTDCKIRFGVTAPLDFGGFPALGRL